MFQRYEPVLLGNKLANTTTIAQRCEESLLPVNGVHPREADAEQPAQQRPGDQLPRGAQRHWL